MSIQRNLQLVLLGTSWAVLTSELSCKLQRPVRTLTLQIAWQAAAMWGWWTGAAAVLVDWRWSTKGSGDLSAPGVRGAWRRRRCCADSWAVGRPATRAQSTARQSSGRCGAFFLLATAPSRRWQTAGCWGNGCPFLPLKWSAQVKHCVMWKPNTFELKNNFCV